MGPRPLLGTRTFHFSQRNVRHEKWKVRGAQCLALTVVNAEGLSIRQGDLEVVDATRGAGLDGCPNTQLRATVVSHQEGRVMTRAAHDFRTAVETNAQDHDVHGPTTNGRAHDSRGVCHDNRRRGH